MKNKNIAFYWFYPALQMLIANKTHKQRYYFQGGCIPLTAYIASTKEAMNKSIPDFSLESESLTS
ncbi:MAG: hypothetical protein ACU826_10175 [Gammaproteobacteria bacterium]